MQLTVPPALERLTIVTFVILLEIALSLPGNLACQLQGCPPPAQPTDTGDAGDAGVRKVMPYQ